MLFWGDIVNWLAIAFLIWNVVIAIMYAVDKRCARRGCWRISEATLIVPAFLMGSFGAMLGIILFNHKTSKMKFRLLIPFAFLVNVGTVLLFNNFVK